MTDRVCNDITEYQMWEYISLHCGGLDQALYSYFMYGSKRDCGVGN